MNDKKDDKPDTPKPEIPDTLPADIKSMATHKAQTANWTEFLKGDGDITEYSNGKKTDYPSR